MYINVEIVWPECVVLFVIGITAEEFVERPKIGPLPSDYGPSRLEKLRQLLANELGIPINNVQVFSIMNSPATAKTVDIRFAAHGSPYYRSDRLDGIVMTQRQKVGLFIIVNNSYLMLSIDRKYFVGVNFTRNCSISNWSWWM